MYYFYQNIFSLVRQNLSLSNQSNFKTLIHYFPFLFCISSNNPANEETFTMKNMANTIVVSNFWHYAS